MRLGNYLRLRKALLFWVDGAEGTSKMDQADAEFVWQYTRPYVCVIHEPTGKGYYLDRNYGYLVTIDNMPRPGSTDNGEIPNELIRVVQHETEPNHRAASFTTPEWAERLPVDQFTTFWLY